MLPFVQEVMAHRQFCTCSFAELLTHRKIRGVTPLARIPPLVRQEEGAYCCAASLELHLSSTAHLAKVCSKDSAQEGELGATDSLGVFCLFRSSKRLDSASKSMKLCSFPTKK